MTLILQTLLAILATYNGPSMDLAMILDLPPLWLALNLLTVVLALHATDLVAAGWSRVYVYGCLAIALFGRQLDDTVMGWFSERLFDASRWLLNGGYIGPGDAIGAMAQWFADDGVRLVGALFDAIFWPFRVMAASVVSGSFSPTQALAPAMIIIYAAILFVLAADFFATKDLYLGE
jgi:hypothetical protein